MKAVQCGEKVGRQRSSVREELRVQGFPEDFHFPDDVPVGRQRELVGNSMPVNVVAALLRALKNTGVFSGKRRKSNER